MEQAVFDFGDEIEIPSSDNWSIRKEDLQQLVYGDLESVFYGVHNLVVPVEMLNVENPDEIIANYLGAGVLKRYNYHLKKGLPRDFLELVGKINNVAYNSTLGRIKKNCIKKFSSRHYAQRRRLFKLDDSVKQEFVDSFFTAYRPSLREEPSNSNAFYDPNVDRKSKKAYIDKIYNFLEKSFQQQ